MKKYTFNHTMKLCLELASPSTFSGYSTLDKSWELYRVHATSPIDPDSCDGMYQDCYEHGFLFSMGMLRLAFTDRFAFLVLRSLMKHMVRKRTGIMHDLFEEQWDNAHRECLNELMEHSSPLLFGSALLTVGHLALLRESAMDINNLSVTRDLRIHHNRLLREHEDLCAIEVLNETA